MAEMAKLVVLIPAADKERLEDARIAAGCATVSELLRRVIADLVRQPA